MTLYEKVIAALPALEGTAAFVDGTIVLQNDADGSGDYIAAWNHSEILPKELESYLR